MHAFSSDQTEQSARWFCTKCLAKSPSIVFFWRGLFLWTGEGLLHTSVTHAHCWVYNKRMQSVLQKRNTFRANLGSAPPTKNAVSSAPKLISSRELFLRTSEGLLHTSITRAHSLVGNKRMLSVLQNHNTCGAWFVSENPCDFETA